MRNTTIRLATGLTVIVLGAFAIALAQYDARNRSSQQMIARTPEIREAIPIAINEIDSSWLEPKSLIGPDAVVRGNDGQDDSSASSFTLSDDNPLRAKAKSESRVVLASDTQLIPAPTTQPAKPNFPSTAGSQPLREAPTWPSSSNTAQPVGSAPSIQSLNSQRSSTASLASPPGPTPVQSPSLATPAPNQNPLLGQLTQAATANGLPATLPNQVGLPAILPTSPKTTLQPPSVPVSNTANRQSLSDTQLPILPVTDLARPEPARQKNTPALPQRSAFANAQDSPSLEASARPGAIAQSNSSAQNNSTLAAPHSMQQPLLRENLGSPSQIMNRSNGMPTSSAGQSASSYQSSLVDRDATAGSMLTSLQSRSPAVVASLVSNEPGNRFLDGPQNGTMLIQKRIPEEIQVGRRAPVVITVRNNGNTTAHEVFVVDKVPRGAEFVDANPPVSPTADGLLMWQLGEMAAGDERTINLQIIPRSEGDIGSTFSVYSAVQGSVRTVATLPKLEITHVANPSSLIGAQHEIKVSIRNAGSGIARNVRMEADLPQNLRHSSGEFHLETMLDQLHPNQSVTVPLACIAAEPGTGQAVIRAVIDENVEVQHPIDVQVVAPSLQATIEGPNVRYLERPAVYRLHVQNNGTAAATNCDMILRLPAGLKFNEASNFGEYVPAQHAIFWDLESIPAGKIASTEVKLMPVETGPQMLNFQVAADLDVKAETKGQLVVHGQAELAFSIEEDNDTIETGSTTTYSVNVSNVGSRPDQNIQLVVQIPASGKVVRVDPSLKFESNGELLRFEPVPQMDSRDQRIFRFEVQYNKPGTHVVRAQLTSQNWAVPVIKEEGTHVYNDRE